MYGMALEAEDLFEPVNGGRGVAVAMAGDDGAVEIRHGEPSAPIVTLSFAYSNAYILHEQSVILCDMRLPTGDSLLVQIMDTAFAQAAKSAGKLLVCKPGCSQCCHGAFVLNPLDTLRIRAGMDTIRASDPALAARIEGRARAWIDEHGAQFPGDVQTGVLGDSKIEEERFEDFANDAACPVLNPDSGSCDLYAWRPMTCRVFGPPVRMGDGEELGHCELCFAGAGKEKVAACEMTIPYDLEEELLDEIPLKEKTVVAFALLD
jgi:Fe-S-cluster containining protein